MTLGNTQLIRYWIVHSTNNWLDIQWCNSQVRFLVKINEKRSPVLQNQWGMNDTNEDQVLSMIFCLKDSFKTIAQPRFLFFLFLTVDRSFVRWSSSIDFDHSRTKLIFFIYFVIQSPTCLYRRGSIVFVLW